MTTAEATAVRLDLDLEGGRITAPGRMLGIEALQPNLETILQGEAPTFAAVVLSKGDRRPVDLALVVDGVPQQIDVLTIKAALKEFETGRRYDIHEGDGTGFQLVQRGGLPRYRFLISLTASQMRRILQSYADPLGTFVDLIAEVETQFRYNPSDYSPGAVSTQSVATGSQTVYVPVPFIQANGTRNYRLSVTASVLPDFMTGGWGSAPIWILDQSVNITVSGGSVVAQNLSITPGTRGTESPSTTFTPHWLTSMDPVRIDPIDGGFNLRVDVITSAMSTAVFGAMPATIWRAEKVKMRHLWVNGYYHAWDSVPDTFTFLNASGGVIGSHTMPNLPSFGVAPANVSNAVGAFTLFVSRKNTYHSDLVWKAEPTAKFVRTAISGDVPVVAEAVPAGPSIRFDVSLIAQGPEEEAEVTRVSSQSFVVRLRRDLIPDVTPDTGGS